MRRHVVVPRWIATARRWCGARFLYDIFMSSALSTQSTWKQQLSAVLAAGCFSFAAGRECYSMPRSPFDIVLEKDAGGLLPYKRARELTRAFCSIENSSFEDPWSEAMIAQSLALDSTVVLSSQCDRAVVGFIIAGIAADVCEVQDIAVLPSVRRMGAGGAMLDMLFSLCASRGITELQLEVRASNSAAVSLYVKKGFEQVGIRRGYYSFPREDAVLMTAFIEKRCTNDNTCF